MRTIQIGSVYFSKHTDQSVKVINIYITENALSTEVETFVILKYESGKTETTKVSVLVSAIKSGSVLETYE